MKSFRLNMKNNFWLEFLISIILIILAVILLNPLDFWMPQPVEMSIMVSLAVVFIVFSLLIWQENAKDEREALHRYIAARFAYISATAVLILGIILQSLRHILDPWLVIAIVVMVLAKISGRIYSQLKH